MIRLALLIGFALAAAAPATAQTSVPGTSGGGAGETSMASLLRSGYEIKAASPSGSRFVVFLQKDQQAYACEFVTLTSSRCGEIR